MMFYDCYIKLGKTSCPLDYYKSWVAYIRFPSTFLRRVAYKTGVS